MKKLVVLITVLILLLVVFHFTKTTIQIRNMTEGNVCIFVGTSERDVDPDYEELKASRRALLVPPMEAIYFSLSLADYFMKKGEVNIGWRIGGVAGAETKRVAYRNLHIVSGMKYCSLKIDISEHADRVFYMDGGVCIKSIEMPLELK